MQNKLEFRGGNIANHINEWEEITSNKTILNWIRNGIEIPFSSIPLNQTKIKNYKKFSQTEKQFISEELNKLCKEKCIVPCDTQPDFVSPVSVIPKKRWLI